MKNSELTKTEKDQDDFLKRVAYAKKMGKDNTKIDWKRNAGEAATPEDPPKKKLHMKPKGERGRIAVQRLGRNYKTGDFDRAVKAMEREGLSSESAHNIEGAKYWKKVRAHKRGQHAK